MIPPEFLAAIIENKADDLPRLVLADWLDEHGENERAEFIRIQCATASKPCHAFMMSCYENGDDCNCGDDPEHNRLCDRAMNLLATYRLKWCEGIPGPPPHVTAHDWAVFRRGFISTITCSWQDWLTHATAILQATPLERVRMTTMPTLVDNPYDTPLSSEWCSRRWPGIEFELPRTNWQDVVMNGNYLPDNPLVRAQ